MPYGGVGIYDCWNDGDIAITFDDGPYEYTNDLLDLLAVRSQDFSPLSPLVCIFGYIRVLR